MFMMFDSTQVSPVLPPSTRHKLGSKNLSRLLLTAFHNSPEFTSEMLFCHTRKYHLSLSLFSLETEREIYFFDSAGQKVVDLLTSGSINSLWSLPHCKTCNTRKWEGSEESSDIVALSSHLASKYQLKMIGPANTERRIGLMAWYYLPQCNLSNGELQHTLNIGTANWLQLMFLVRKILIMTNEFQELPFSI